MAAAAEHFGDDEKPKVDGPPPLLPGLPPALTLMMGGTAGG